MPALTAEEVTRYQQDGIVIPKVGLDATTVAELRTKLDSFLAEQKITDADYVPDIIERDPSWLRYGVMPEILDAVAQLIGEDIIIWGSALFCKAGKGGKATPWHQDGHYWPIRPLATVTAWIAIDDVNVENSCLRVIPGSHRDRVSYAHDVDNSDTIILNQVLKPEHLQSAPPRDIELSPGRFSIHDVYLIHGANPNNSGKRRAGMVFRYMPASSHFDREMAARQVRDMGVLDLSRRKLHLVRGVDRSGRNDIAR
ncbi:MAG: phytanoyl-CoA dioxygenase family protein [Rubrivivax sp.]|jgi:phytanoyl-CoA hydroxylase|nr:phytanoyl-CoA dioxygenase family protein [Rubrivivax sp.]